MCVFIHFRVYLLVQWLLYCIPDKLVSDYFELIYNIPSYPSIFKTQYLKKLLLHCFSVNGANQKIDHTTRTLVG